MTSKRAAAVALVAALVGLTGCGSINYDLSAHDAIGTWRAGNDLPTQIEVRSDGTFRATEWPSNAWCEGKATPSEVRALDVTDPRSFAGTWDFSELGGPDKLTFRRTDGADCEVGVSGDFREEDGDTYVCFRLPGTILGSERVDNLFVFYRDEPRSVPREDTCFNYN